MDQGTVACALLTALLLAGCGTSPEAQLRKTLASQTTGVIHLPPGEIEISSELTLAPGAHGLEIAGSGTRLKAADNFKGRAILVLENAERVHLHDFMLDGNRGKLAKPLEMAPPENAFRVWYPNNGILANKVAGLEIERLELSGVVNFPILVSQSSKVRISSVAVLDSGSKNARGRNNLSGGILLEEGTTDFEVRDSTFQSILGNALWTHSNFRAPRQEAGIFALNKFDTIGRDAIQVGHATRVRVDGNTGVNIGYPIDIVDVENQGTPVAIDTAGNVDNSSYARNQFKEINGQCIDLDGFHDGIVEKNICTNEKGVEAYPFGGSAIVMNNTHPDTHSSNIEIRGNVIEGSKFGGLFLMGSRNRVIENVFLGLNLAHGDEPEILTSGIYLGPGVARLEETTGNEIRGNRILGYKMKTRCIVFGPAVSRTANTVAGNTCADQAPAR
ncbi:MAG: right-handed parallel beta-helix repeat-containing protein [Acidobacteriia bacterium]|nr:right-handed parallel beta-helix repeat-containing protein [Terriglobia bacterium]